MLDIGFLPDILRITRHLPSRNDKPFFSATKPAPILQLAKEMLRNPATINTVLDGFKSGKDNILVATDTVSRGIDVESPGRVVNFNVPMAPKDSIHRFG